MGEISHEVIITNSKNLECCVDIIVQYTVYDFTKRNCNNIDKKKEA